jgi:hypothetical protein
MEVFILFWELAMYSMIETGRSSERRANGGFSIMGGDSIKKCIGSLNMIVSWLRLSSPIDRGYCRCIKSTRLVLPFPIPNINAPRKEKMTGPKIIIIKLSVNIT